MDQFQSLRESIPHYLWDELGRKLHTAEEILLVRYRSDGFINFPLEQTSNHEIDFKRRFKWGDERIIRAPLLEWLLRDPVIVKQINPNGLNFQSVKIVGQVNLTQASLGFSLTFWNCVIKEKIWMWNATTKDVAFLNCELGEIFAERAHFEGVLQFEKCRIRGCINISSSYLKTEFCLKEVIQRSNSESCVNAQGITVDGSVLFQRCRFGNVIELQNADIKRSLHFDLSKIVGTDKILPVSNAASIQDLPKPMLNLALTKVGNDCAIMNAKFLCSEKAQYYLRLEGALIKRLFLVNILSLSYVGVSLCDVHCITFCDDETSWPKAGKLDLSGFVFSRYDRFSNRPYVPVHKRLKWLQLQSAEHFNSHPWQQLAKVY